MKNEANGVVQFVQLELSRREVLELLKLLDDHTYYGWIELEGEFGVAATGEVSEVLRNLYRRLKQEVA